MDVIYIKEKNSDKVIGTINGDNLELTEEYKEKKKAKTNGKSNRDKLSEPCE